MNKLFTFLLCLVSIMTMAQEAMEVQRCADIDRRVPIRNIYIDANNNKWVADEQGLFLAQSPDFAKAVDVDPSQWSLLSVADGNEEINLPKADLQKIMGDDFSKITCAHFDKTKKELYIGTSTAGVFQLRTTPAVSLIKKMNEDNSKLRTNNISTLFINPKNQLLIGTEDGLLIKQGKKEELVGKYFSINALAYVDNTIWVLADNEIMELDRKKEFYSLEIQSDMSEGDIVDIDFDSQGRLWIASEIISRYNFESDTYDVFGPAENFTSQFVNYIVTDSDDALWVGTDDKGVYFIGKASSMSASVKIDDPLGCDADAQNASLQVRASGGEPPYSYKWSGKLQGDNPGDLGPGTYAVTVTDKNGKSVEAKRTIDDPRLSVSIAQQKEASAGGGSDATASITVSGGNPKYTYKWDNGETTKVASKLNAGEHSVTISDRNGCSTTSTIVITEMLAEFNVVLEQTAEINCAGETTASLQAKASGGQGPYQYKWSTPTASGESATQLASGNYQITATDATGNTTNTNITIAQPDALAVSIRPKTPATTNNKDGQATASTKGGDGQYTFKWDTGESGETAKQLGAGTHTVTVTDGKGCTSTASIDITEDILPLAVTLKTSSELKCAGDNAASLMAEVSGGKSPFQYKWSAPDASGAAAKDLTAGDYTLTVVDAAGNSADASFSIKEPKKLTVSITPKSPANTNQADGKAVAKAEGGSGKYSYEWDNGESNNTAKKLAAGKHQVVVTDANGCTTTAIIDITEDILPLAIEIKSGNELKCTGDNSASLQAEVSGGKSPFQYKWSGTDATSATASNLKAGNYELIVTDAAGSTAKTNFSIEEPKALSASITPKSPATANNADGKASVKATGGSGKYTYKWDTGESDNTAKKLAAGKHEVTITDANGCTATAGIDVTEDILPLAVELTNNSAIKCAGEKSAALAVEVSGGKSPFQYAWNNDISKGEAASQLGAGAYEVTVTDAAGNSAIAKQTIKEPKTLTASIAPKSPASTNQADGKAIAKGAGGKAPYSYKWKNGENTETAQKLAAGEHQVVITDANGCTATADIIITEDILPLTASLNQSAEIKCQGGQTAAIQLEVAGGKSPFEYKWNAGTISGTSASGLGAGTYVVTITDTNGSTKESSIEIKEPATLSVSLDKSTPTTNENSKDGKATLLIKGGTAPYTQQWDNGESASAASKLSFGKHAVTVTDANNCSQSLDFETEKKILPALTAGRLRKGQTLQVSQLFFMADSTNMTEESYPSLNEIASFLKENPLVVIEVGGHTNDVPETAFCDQLSTARAKSVATYVVQQGIDDNRVVYKGYGKRKPKYSNRTADGRKKNQRVEIKILRLQ